MGIALDQKKTLQKFFSKRAALPWLNIIDSDGAISERLKITQFPTYLLIDKNGTHFATTTKSEEINALIKEKLNTK